MRSFIIQRSHITRSIRIGLAAALVAALGMNVAGVTAPAQAATSYTVTYNANGGTGTVASGSYDASSNTAATVASSSGMSNNGSTFIGWNTVPDGSGTSYPVGSAYYTAANVTLYAQWLPNANMYLDATNSSSYPGTGSTWTDLSGGSHTGTLSGAVNYDSSNKALNFTGTTHGTGYVTLNGSFNDFSTGFTVEFESMFRSHATYNWARIFDFSPALNNHVNGFWVGQYATDGEIAVEVRNSTGGSDGYCETSTGGTAITDGVFAKWMITIDTSNTNQCRIYKNGIEQPTQRRDGTRVVTAGPNATGGVPFVLPATSSRASNFVGASNWSADNDLNGEIRYVRTYTSALSAAKALAASTATVAFHPNASGFSGSMASQTSTTQSGLSAVGFSRPGYTFAGWNTAANGSGTAYADGAVYPFSSSVVLYAQWTALPTATVTFNANYAGGPTSSQTSWTATTLTPNSWSRSGLVFVGWNTAANGSGTSYADGAQFGFASSITLYAQWAKAITVTFCQPKQTSGKWSCGSVIGTQVAALGSTVALSSFPAATSCEVRALNCFYYWSTDPQGLATPYYDGANFTFNANTTLYAVSTVAVTVYFAIGFNGMTDKAAQTAAGGATVKLNPLPFTTPAGYVFTGWKDSLSGKIYGDGASYTFPKYDGTRRVSPVITLTAQWAKGVTVSFNYGTVAATTTQTVLPGKTAALKANTVSRGKNYTFAGWNTQADGKGTAYADGANFTFTTDTTLYAQWTYTDDATLAYNAALAAGLKLSQIAVSTKVETVGDKVTFTTTWSYGGYSGTTQLTTSNSNLNSLGLTVDRAVANANSDGTSQAIAFLLMHSTPTVLSTVNLDTASSTQLNAQLPEQLEPGVHHLTLEIPMAASNEMGVVTLAYFAVKPDGSLVGYYPTEPEAEAALAQANGTAATPTAGAPWGIWAGVGLGVLAVAAVSFVLWRRRRAG